MITITLKQLQEMIVSGNWAREADITFEDSVLVDREVYTEDGVELQEVLHRFGGAQLESRIGGITITTFEGFNYDDEKPETFSASTEGMDEIVQIEGAIVLDEDGDELSQQEIADELTSDFFLTKSDYKGLLVALEA